VQNKRKIQFLQILIFISFLGIWEATSRLGWLDPFFFSSPSELIQLLVNNSSDITYLHHILATTYETLLSFLLVTALSFLIAYGMWWNRLCASIVEPYFIVLNSIPKSALTPLFIVWLGTGTKTIIVAGISVAIFGSVLSFYQAFQSCDLDKLLLIQTLGGSKRNCFYKAVLPSSFPTLITQSKVNIGLCLVGVIIGEFLAAREGLGYLILYSSQIFVLKQVILSILVLMALAYILYRPLQSLEKKYQNS